MNFEWDQRRGADAVDRVYWSSDHTYWSYHTKRENGDVKLSKDWVMYYVDDELQPLVNLFLDNGIPTTPSCAGHSITEPYLKSLWQSLMRDQERINTTGLKLTNNETGEDEIWYDRDFRFSMDKNDFRWALVGIELGFMGFIVPESVGNHLITLLTPKMPPMTKISKWNDVSPGFVSVGIENLSTQKEHTWNYIYELFNHYFDALLRNSSTAVS